MVEIVFMQTERVEIIDGDGDRAVMQAKPWVDTGVVALTCLCAGAEWVVGTGVLSQVG